MKREAPPPRRRSLRVELVVVLSLVVMMATVSLSLAGELLGARRHRARQAEELGRHAESLAALVAPRLTGPGAPSEAELEAVLRPSIGALGVGSVVLFRQARDDEGVVLLELGLPTALPPPRALPSAFEREGQLVVDVPVRSRGVHVLRLVASPLSWTRQSEWGQILLLAGGIGVVLVVMGAALLEMQVLAPLARIRAAVGAVARGDLTAKAPEEGPVELRALAGSFNEMTASLAARVREVEQQREQLVRSEQLATVGRVAAGMAHEVGNPLAAILGYVELLLDPRTQPALEPEHADLLQRCRQQITRIQGLIGQLLDYSRPATSQSVRTPLLPAIESLLSLLRHDPRCKGVTLEAGGDPAIALELDPARLDQVLQNLVVNGARAAGPEGTVRVEVACDAEQVTIDVHDSGPGISDEVRPRLFEPFFTTARAGEGSGLGLAICQGLVESMGGSLECLPAAAIAPLPGRARPGARFRVSLPLAQAR